jgi:GTP-binding protein Era
VDVVGCCLPADERIGPGDRRIVGELAERVGPTPVIAVVTKIDKVSRERLAEQLVAVAALAETVPACIAEIVPVSAVSGEGVDVLVDLLIDRLPAGPMLYPDAESTDEPIETRIAELVREAALDGVRDELPHSLAAMVTEMLPPEPDSAKPVTKVYVTLFVERPSQKPIVLGHKGSRLSSVGRRARLQIEQLLGTRVYLDLHVAVAKDWQRDPKKLRTLGFGG